MDRSSFQGASAGVQLQPRRMAEPGRDGGIRCRAQAIDTPLALSRSPPREFLPGRSEARRYRQRRRRGLGGKQGPGIIHLLPEFHGPGHHTAERPESLRRCQRAPQPPPGSLAIGRPARDGRCGHALAGAGFPVPHAGHLRADTGGDRRVAQPGILRMDRPAARAAALAPAALHPRHQGRWRGPAHGPDLQLQ